MQFSIYEDNVDLHKMYVVMGPFSNSSLLEGVTTCLRFVEGALGKAELIQTIFSITTQATNYEWN